MQWEGEFLSSFGKVVPRGQSSDRLDRFIFIRRPCLTRMIPSSPRSGRPALTTVDQYQRRARGKAARVSNSRRKVYMGGTTPSLPNRIAPLSKVPSACFSVGTKTIAPGLMSLLSAGTSATIGTFGGMVIFFSPPL